MLILKMVVTLQLLWFAAGVVDTIFSSRMRVPYSCDRFLRGIAGALLVAGVK